MKEVLEHEFCLQYLKDFFGKNHKVGSYERLIKILSNQLQRKNILLQKFI